MPQNTDSVHVKLRKAWLKWQALILSRGTAYTIAWLVLIALVELAIDWTFELSSTVRTVLLFVNIAAVVTIVYAHVARHVSTYDPVRQALREEADHPELENLLVSYCQLDENDTSTGMSPGMIRAAKERAAEQAAGLQFGASARFARMRLAVTLCLLAVVVLAAGCILRPGIFSAFVYRMAMPTAAITYPTHTRIASVTGDVLVRQYDPVTAVARAEGEVPDKAQIHVRRGKGGWQRIPVPRTDADKFAHAFESVGQSFDYRFKIGDTSSAIHRVTVVRPPHITDAELRLDFPDYTGKPTEKSSDLNVEVPEGTTVKWTLHLDRAVERARIAPAEGKPVTADVHDDGKTVTASMTADASIGYRLRFRWKLNGQEHTDATARHFIQVTPDAPPRVAISYPRRSGKATLSKTLRVVFSATDRYGISAASFVYTLNDGPEKRRKLEADDGDFKEYTITVTPSELVPDLKKGDTISYWVDVADNRAVADGPQRRTSRVMRLQFVSREEYLAEVRERRARYLGRLKPIYHQQREAYDHLTELVTGASDRSEKKKDTSQ